MFAICLPERTTKTVKRPKPQNTTELAFGMFPSDHSPGKGGLSSLLSPLLQSKQRAFPVTAQSQLAAWACLQRQGILHCGSGTPAAPLLGKLTSSASGLLCTSAEQLCITGTLSFTSLSLLEHPILPETAISAAELWTESFFYCTFTAKKLICHDLPIHLRVKPRVREEIF